MPRPSLLLLLILLVGTPLVAYAQVYQWTDAHGTVHYADTPPPQGVHYKDVKIVGNTVMNAAPAPTTPTQTDADTDQAAPRKPGQPINDTPANRKQLCATLDANVILLNKNGPVITKDSHGKSHALSKDQRAQALKKMRQQQQTYCQS